MEKEYKLGSILSYVSIFVSVIVGFLYTPLMIKTLGKSEYGLYNTISSTVSMLSLLSLGFGSGYIKYYSIYKSRDDINRIYKLNGLFFIVFLIIGFVAFLCGLFLVFNLNLIFDEGLTTSEYDTAQILMLLLSINMAIFFPSSVLDTIIQANEKFVFLKIVTILKTICSPLIALPLFFLGLKSIAVVISVLAVSIIATAVQLFYVKLILKNKFLFKGFDKGLFIQIFKYTSLIAVHIAVDQINWNVDNILLGRFKGTEEVAIYSVGYLFCSYYIMLGLPVASIFTPRVFSIENSNLKRDKKNEELSNLFINVGRIQFFVCLLVCSGYIFFGRQFIKYWVGEGYDSSYYVGLLLIIPCTVDLIQHISIEIQRARNLHYFRALIYGVMAIINVVISIFLCKKFGAVGSAVGTSISFVVVQGIIMNVYYCKKLNLNMILFWKNIFLIIKKLIPVLMLGVPLIFVEYDSFLKLAFSILIYASLYLLFSLKFCLNSEERKIIKGILK